MFSITDGLIIYLSSEFWHIFDVKGGKNLIYYTGNKV